MTRKCWYCGVTYSVKAYDRCPFGCPWLIGAAGLHGGLQNAQALGYASSSLQQQAIDAYKKGVYEMVTLKKLQAQIKILQDIVVSQADKISVLEVEIGQVSLTPSPAPSEPRMDKGRKRGKNK